MKNKHLYTSFLLLLSFFFVSPAQGLKKGGHVKATLVSESASIQPGAPFWVALHQKMEPHWHTYWINAGESGTPTEITWKLPPGFTAGPIQWPAPAKLEVPPVVSYGYEDELLLLVQITPPADIKTANVTLAAHADWLECEQVCIPGAADVSLTLPVKKEFPAPNKEWIEKFAKARFEWPLGKADWKVTASKHGDKFRLSVSPIGTPAEGLKDLYFFSESFNAINYSAPQEFSKEGQGGHLDLVISDTSTEPAKNLVGVLVTSDGWRGTGTEKALYVNVPIGAAASSAKPTLALAILFAFIGGLILNLMPCVLPILSIKILGFVNQAGGNAKDSLKHGLVFALGVLVSFWALAGALIAFRASGQAIGWGFQLQSPVFVLILAILFLILSLNMLGLFEIGTSLTRLGGVTQGKTGLGGSFVSGVFATIVATPCTAPFMGSALGFALTQPTWVSFLVFTSLGTGMALPYVILSANPALLKIVPKPGPWMDTFKKFMGLLLLATVGWLGLVFYNQVRPPAPIGTVKGEGLVWEPYSEERIAELRNEGRIVFLDFTASWCLTCKVNERVAINSKDVVALFKDKNVALMKADWTSQDEKISKKLEEFGRSGVPFYVIYPSKKDAAPVTLPEILTPGIVLSAFEKIQ